MKTTRKIYETREVYETTITRKQDIDKGIQAYGLLKLPSHVGNALEIYVSSDGLIEMLVNWTDFSIKVFKKEIFMCNRCIDSLSSGQKTCQHCNTSTKI